MDAKTPLEAAAPDLLAALESFPGYDGSVSFAEIWAWLAKRDAAIAKARKLAPVSPYLNRPLRTEAEALAAMERQHAGEGK